MFNQATIHSVQYQGWNSDRLHLYTQVKNFCRSNNTNFFLSFDVVSNDQTTWLENSHREKNVYMCLFDLIPDHAYWQKINGICTQSGKIVFVITDNILKFDNLEFVKFFSCPELLGILLHDVPAKTQLPNKLYNCFIQRVDSVRQSWFYFLYHHDLLDKGYVSLLLKQLADYSTATGKDLFDYIHQKHALYQLPHFEQAYQNLKDQVPYCNFDDDRNLVPLIQDSKYSLILETYAIVDDQNQWCFTEKLLRALQSTSIVLPFCQKGGIAELKSLGFEFYLDLDHLDQLNWQQRQQELLAFLTNDPVAYDADTLYNISLHNNGLLKSYQGKYQKPDFFDNVFSKVIEI